VDKEKNEVGVFAKSPDLGESRSSVPATIDGESIEVSFNYKYLIDGLANIKSSEILFEVSGQEGPCIIKPVGDASYLYVVMPIKSI
jgi:DNA polymerase-3 subunit beta